ncbi:phosphate/phosphite/phosphonate ABC transporter substrate-binding protein [Puniceibacterium sediminis]|uniref:ABC transporter, phosphonate, substrate-binding protein n=1 Tax=Puniceibacterium sediminis TaxID=1608407 RepID=A0A238UUW1_9RHOB|nr:PhnD/SsuA/transferrin family substrate-binding protein [Puniceibacterium sediminis]SNR25985.1 ABC transporter, phosphonate, substrate-binding protein [Puniceibacterium sediminis]
MIAFFPMYDRAETASANDALWAAFRARLGYGPDRLDREIGLWDGWENPELLLSQTCGLPYRTRLQGKVTLVGSPDYGLPGCAPGFYNSVLVTRADNRHPVRNLLGQRLVINQHHSQSGHAAMVSHAQWLGANLGTMRESGGHIESAHMVARNEADLAVIDAHTWRLIQRYEEVARELRECDRTMPTPATPFITARGTDPQPLFVALRSALEDLPPETRAILNLRAIVDIPHEVYVAVKNPVRAFETS